MVLHKATLAFMIAAALAICVHAQSHKTTAAKITTSPVIDGKLTEGVWQSAKKIEISAANPAVVYPGSIFDGPQDCRAEFAVLWDDSGLYVGTWFYDDIHQAPHAKSMITATRVHDDDGLEWWVTINYNDAYADPASPYFGTFGWQIRKGFNTNKDLAGAVVYQRDGYVQVEVATPDDMELFLGFYEKYTSDDGINFRSEAKIPWAGRIMSNKDSAMVGDQIGFNLGVNDNDDGRDDAEGNMRWTGTDNWTSPDSWGLITLGGPDFNPNAPYIRIIAPAANETVLAATIYTIRWQSNLTGMIDFYQYTGCCSKLLGSALASVGKLYWRLPPIDAKTDNFQIVAVESNTAYPVSDTSGFFTVKPSYTDPYEPNEDQKSAYQLRVGDTLRNAFLADRSHLQDACEDEDWFVFGAIKYQRLTIGLDLHGKIPQYELYDEQLNLVGSQVEHMNVPATADYYLRVFGRHGIFYKVRVNEEKLTGIEILASSNRSSLLASSFSTKANTGTFQIQVSEPKFMGITIFDLKGNQVMHIAPRLYQKGIHTIGFRHQSKTLPNGVYFVSFQTKTKRFVQRAQLIR